MCRMIPFPKQLLSEAGWVMLRDSQAPSRQLRPSAGPQGNLRDTARKQLLLSQFHLHFLAIKLLLLNVFILTVQSPSASIKHTEWVNSQLHFVRTWKSGSFGSYPLGLHCFWFSRMINLKNVFGKACLASVITSAGHQTWESRDFCFL